jgi:hypothetical protein
LGLRLTESLQGGRVEIGGGGGGAASDVGKAHQSMHQGQLPRVVELKTSNPREIRKAMNSVYVHGQRQGFLPRTTDGNPIGFVRQSLASDFEPVILTLPHAQPKRVQCRSFDACLPATSAAWWQREVTANPTDRGSRDGSCQNQGSVAETGGIERRRGRCYRTGSLITVDCERQKTYTADERCDGSCEAPESPENDLVYRPIRANHSANSANRAEFAIGVKKKCIATKNPSAMANGSLILCRRHSKKSRTARITSIVINAK